MKPILVTSYVNPDLDGVAGMAAYAEFLQKTGRDAMAAIIGVPHDEAQYILERFGIPCPEMIANADNFDEVILVDTSDVNGLEGRITPGKVVEVIDHRKVHEAGMFPRARVQIELVGAAATLVAEKFMQYNTEISVESATLLFGAIVSNTINFKGSGTTERDQESAAWLNRVAKLPENFWHELFVAKSDLSGTKLNERIKGDFAWFVIGEKKVGIAQIEIIGAKKLIEERGGEVVQILDKIKSEMNLDFIFQNTIELEGSEHYLVASDTKTKELLEKALNIHFSGISAVRPGLIMRKQIVPLLKEELEHASSKVVDNTA